MSNFTLDITRFVEHTGASFDVVVKKVVLELARSVIRKSPVDTGRFKGNWQLGVGSAPSSEVDVNDTTALGIPAPNSNRGKAINNMLGVIPRQGAAGLVYYIVNNLPYAQALEDGHSIQSPPGNMVHDTVSDFQRFIDDAIR